MGEFGRRTPLERGLDVQKYRLAVARNGHGSAPRGPEFPCAKAAIAYVATVAGEDSAHGPIREIELQAVVAERAEWRTVERWGAEVVARIRRQRGIAPEPEHARAETPATLPTALSGLTELEDHDNLPTFDLPDVVTPSAAAAIPAPAIAPAPAAPRVRRAPKRQRWHVVGTAGLLIIVWAALLIWMTGGDLGLLWDGPSAQAAVAEDLRWAIESGPTPAAPANSPTGDTQ